jgi:hypothetical protein
MDYTTRKIKLNLISDIQDFVATSQMVGGLVTVSSIDGRYSVDGKSLLGLMSLNLSKPVIVEYPSSEGSYFRHFLDRFAVEESL